MKLLLLPLVLLLFSSCLEEASKKELSLPEFKAQIVSRSERSRKVEQRVAPRLISELKAMDLEYGAPVFLRLFKQEKLLELWLLKEDKYSLFKTYEVAAASGDLGPKLKEGDGQSPEGFYEVFPRQMNPSSSYHLSFNLGFPNAYDRSRGRTGSYLMVHGSFVSIGCYAMTDKRIEEIYTLCDAALRNGQRCFNVHAFPFRITSKNLSKYKDSKNYPFWLNLKQGYDFFERERLPPRVSVINKVYLFKSAHKKDDSE